MNTWLHPPAPARRHGPAHGILAALAILPLIYAGFALYDAAPPLLDYVEARNLHPDCLTAGC